MKISLLSVAFCATALAESLSNVVERQSNWTVGQTVQTRSGPIQGHAASNATRVSEYLGIPFAKPPIGDLRWEAPQKYSGNSTINGTSFVS
jgi:cholinesterase